MYSGTPLLWTPWRPGGVSCIERCPHFRGEYMCILGRSIVSLVQRCPYFKVGLYKGFHCTVLIEVSSPLILVADIYDSELYL